MKILLFIIGMVGAGLIGFSFEPNMRMELTGKEKGRLVDKDKDKGLVDGGPMVIDLAKWPADRLPKKVKLKVSAEVTSKADGLKVTVPAGSDVDLVKLEGNKVVIRAGGDDFEGTVGVGDTDLADQVAAMAKTAPVVAVDAGKPEVAVVPEPEVAVVPEVVPVPEPEVVVVPEVVPVPEPEVAVVPEVVPVPVPEVPVSPVEDGPVGDVVGIMQASIRGGEISEFTFEQVLEWEPVAGKETVDGESYDTGLVSYRAETVFGVKTIQAKALIRSGKVVRWLWPKSGMVIK